MVKNLLSTAKAGLLYFIVVFTVLFTSNTLSAQCAGSDNAVPPICDIPNSSSQTINLFSYLGGTPTAGGTWTDDNLSGGLNSATGILNAQKIKSSGFYSYTYTVNNILGCTDNSAKVFVTIGGYPGVGSIGNVCKDDTGFNLFQVFDSRTLDPQVNGTWLDDDGTGALTRNFLDATNLIVDKTYHFTYKMGAVGSCVEKSTTIQVVIKQPVYSGSATDLKLCSNELVGYTNYNLHSSLSGEDPNGTWSEFGTDEITGLTDSAIDIQNIYNSRGPGVYRFDYTVLSKNLICPNKMSTVNVILEKQIDFTGASFDQIPPLCENEINTTIPIRADFIQGTQNIPDGLYDITYTISGVPMPITVTESFINGKLTLLMKATHFIQSGNYTIAIINIVKKGATGICTIVRPTISTIFQVLPIPKINQGTLTIEPVCKGFAAAVEISGTTNLTDGNYAILFNLTGSNTAVAEQATFNVTNGIGNFSIHPNLIPNTGNTTIFITKITNTTTSCTNTSTLTKVFVVKALPDLTNFKVDIKSVCINQPVLVSLSGLGNSTAITINYNLIGANVASNQNVTIAVTTGKADFTIPFSFLSNIGTSALVVTYLIDNTSGCGVAIANSSKNFTIHPIPNLPSVTNENFCVKENKTIADLNPKGSQYQWFDSLASTAILNSSTLLVSKTYYVKEVNAATGCESERAAVAVEINEVQVPVLDQDGHSFCGLDNPTLLELTAKINGSGTISWFDSAINGNQLPATTLLREGVTYYGFDYSSSTNCYSSALPVTVSLTNCDETPDFFIPDGFSPNGDAINDTFRILDIEFVYPNYSLEIYNRYGNLMFTGNKNKPEWDGKNSDYKSGLDGFAPNGVYFYIINYNKGTKSPKQGRLYLNR
jgi:gliding motility-associated-like protein